MKNKIIFTLAIAIALTSFVNQTGSAQSFYSFQSIQKHTFFFSLSWQKKVVLGAGYSYRLGGDVQFTDFSAEWKAPLDQFFNGKNFEIIVGPYVRHIAKRQVLATGYHLKLKRITTEEKEATLLGLGLTFIPGYQYAAPTDDSPNGIFGARLTYQPTLLAIVTDKTGEGISTTKAFAAHTIKFGLHADIIFKRALGLALNPVLVYTLASEDSILPDTPSWDFQGDIYFGPTYRLERE